RVGRSEMQVNVAMLGQKLVSSARSRRDLRWGVSKAHSRHGHRASSPRAVKSLAKSVCRKAYWHITTRLSRSCYRAERVSSEAHRCPISRLLLRLADTSFLIDGCAESAGRASAGPGRGGRVPRARRPASPLRTLGRVTGTPRG